MIEEAACEGVVETLPGSWAPTGSRPIELVFRTVGERTSELALELALKHIKPYRAYVIRDVKPWALAVRRMLELDHQCSHVIYVDADCLILEDMRPFLDVNEFAYVDCYVRDRFRGRIHCGVHITRIDVVRMMRAIREPIDTVTYAVSPEAYLRQIALFQLGCGKRFKNFHILHDYFQHFTDIFIKYARRELRSRTEFYKKKLEASMVCWGEDVDFDVARLAVRHAANAVPADATPRQIEQYLCHLPSIARVEVEALGLSQKRQIGIEEMRKLWLPDSLNLALSSKKFKVFGIGLSCTGARSLTMALHALGFDTIHYPTDRATLETLVRGDVRFPLLEHYDGITDITVAPYYEDLDRAWPGSKFVLTVCDEDSWLHFCHDVFLQHEEATQYEKDSVSMEIQRFLHAAVYGSYEFNEERFRRAHRRHLESVTRYFSGRVHDLLVLDILAGEGYEQLAAFLGVPVPTQPFPSQKLMATASKILQQVT